MKKLRIVSTLSLILCFVFLLSSCAALTKGRWGSIFDKDEFVYESNNPVYKTGIQLSYEDCAVEKLTGELVTFVGEKKTSVYNTNLQKSVYETSDADVDVYGGSLVGGESVFWSVKTSSKGIKTIRVYRADGVEIASAEGRKVEEPRIALDLLYFEGVCYRVSEAEILEQAFEYGTYAEFPEIDAGNGEYYYGVEYNNGYDKVLFYDFELNLLSTYTTPSYASVAGLMILDNGDVLLQYAIEEPEDAKKYTIIDEDGTKYTLVTKLINPKNGKDKDIQVDYVLENGYSCSMGAFMDFDDLEIFKDSIKNIAFAYEIVDGRIDEDDVKIYSIGNNGKVKLVLNELCIDQGYNMPEPVAEGYYVLDNDAGQSLLLNEKGEVLDDISDMVCEGNYCYNNRALYNYDLEVIYNFDADGMEQVLRAYENCVLFVKDDDVYLYTLANGSSTNLSKYAYVRDYGDFFVVTKEISSTNQEIQFYNAEGVCFKTVSAQSIGVVRQTENGALVEVFDKNLKQVWYYIGE